MFTGFVHFDKGFPYLHERFGLVLLLWSHLSNFLADFLFVDDRHSTRSILHILHISYILFPYEEERKLLIEWLELHHPTLVTRWEWATSCYTLKNQFPFLRQGVFGIRCLRLPQGIIIHEIGHGRFFCTLCVLPKSSLGFKAMRFLVQHTNVLTCPLLELLLSKPVHRFLVSSSNRESGRFNGH